MSLLSLAKGVAARCNIVPPSSIVTNPDPTAQQLMAALQDAGDEVQERWTWLNLKGPVATFSGDGVTTLFPLPANFGVLSPSDIFVSSLYPSLRLPGPISDELLLQMKEFPFTPYPSVWRPFTNNQIEFFPALGAGEIVSYVYGSKLWITNSMGVPNGDGQWQADTDLSVISERVIRLGGIRNWKSFKGLDFSKEDEDFENCFLRKAGQEDQGRIVDMSSTPLVEGDNWWPGTITDLTDPLI